MRGLCRVLAFGDSITWGAYASLDAVPPYSMQPLSAHTVSKYDTSYPGDLARSLHVSVCNFGVPGELTTSGLPRLRALLKLARPRTVVILEGVNDLASGVSQQVVLDDLERMVDVVQQHHVHPVLATLMPTYYPASHPHHFVNAEVRSLNRAIRLLARHTRVPLSDVETAFLHDRRGVKLTKHGKSYDYLHPNDAGYRVLAGAVARTLRTHHLY